MRLGLIGRLLEEGKLEAAEEHKQRIEQLQRDRRRVLEENNATHQPKFFRYPEYLSLKLSHLESHLWKSDHISAPNGVTQLVNLSLTSVNCSCASFLSPQEGTGRYLGEQQHVLGAEERPWLWPCRFPYTVVTVCCRSYKHLDLHSLYCDLWSRLVLVMSVSHSDHPHSVLEFIRVIALIASAYLSCINTFMQTYYENVAQFAVGQFHFFACIPHIMLC